MNVEMWNWIHLVLRVQSSTVTLSTCIGQMPGRIKERYGWTAKAKSSTLVKGALNEDRHGGNISKLERSPYTLLL